MFSLNETELSVMQMVLLERPEVRRANKTLLKLHHEYGIGVVGNGKIFFDDSAFESIKSLYERFTKGSYQEERIKGMDRFDQAQHSISEKSGSRPVFGSLLMMVSRQPIPIVGGEVLLPYSDGVVYGVEKSKLDLNRVCRIVIVENGVMLQRFSEWVEKLPLPWRGSIFVYRGHEANVRELNDLLADLRGDVLVGVFADYDLAGMVIVNSYAKIRELCFFVPCGWERLSRRDSCNDEAKFIKQSAVGYKELSSKNLNHHVSHIIERGLAVQQENVSYFDSLSECQA